MLTQLSVDPACELGSGDSDDPSHLDGADAISVAAYRGARQSGAQWERVSNGALWEKIICGDRS